jgi:hypothetical protein
MSAPRFFTQPLHYLKWAAIEKPAIFYSIAVGSLGPVLLFVVPPFRRMLGDDRRPLIPLTYPSMLSFAISATKVAPCTMITANLPFATVPSKPREQLKGYDDE